MSLSRKRRRELDRLRVQAEELLEHQRDLLGRAGSVAQEAGRQAKQLNAELVVPRVNEAIDNVRPAVDRGVERARRAADHLRVVAAPLVASALVGTVRSLERLENRDAARQVRTFGEQRGFIEPERKRGGFGRVLAIGIGVTAAAAVGYALYQAFRSDDELWVAPEG
ncbi:MAG: DNA/RNA helicase [Leucobacter sp.]|nr:DNA/RNA helicase [Leucobacter sp.]